MSESKKANETVPANVELTDKELGSVSGGETVQQQMTDSGRNLQTASDKAAAQADQLLRG